MKIDNMVFEKDSNRYLVIETVVYDGKTYAYLVNSSDELDSMFREVVIDNNQAKLKIIDKEMFSKKISVLFMEKILNS